jgi:hypothetical protein
MRRIFAILCLLALCLFCQCKRPAPPDESRVVRSQSTPREHKSL